MGYDKAIAIVKLPTLTSTSTLQRCSPHNNSLLRTAPATQHLVHVTLAVTDYPSNAASGSRHDSLLWASNQINTPPPQLTQRTVKTGISIYRPLRSSNAASSSIATTSHDDSLYQLATKTTWPTSAARNDHPAASNDSTDLSCPQQPSSCIQWPDRSQLTSIKHLAVYPRLDLRQLPSSNVQLRTTTTRLYRLSM